MNKTKGFFNVLPPEGLYPRILLRIYAEKMKLAKHHLYYMFTAISGALVAFVWAFVRLLESLSHSGFYNYFSLIFSDGSVLVSSWKEFAYSLVESFSLPEFIVLLSLSFIVLISIRMLMKNLKIVHTPVRFI